VITAQNVVGLHVTVYDAFGVKKFQTFSQVPDNTGSLVHAQFSSVSIVQQLLQITTFHQLENHEKVLRIFFEIVKLDDLVAIFTRA
jgi:hypothetical protein